MGTLNLEERLAHDAPGNVLAPHAVALVARVDAIDRPVPWRVHRLEAWFPRGDAVSVGVGSSREGEGEDQ